MLQQQICFIENKHNKYKILRVKTTTNLLLQLRQTFRTFTNKNVQNLDRQKIYNN